MGYVLRSAGERVICSFLGPPKTAGNTERGKLAFSLEYAAQLRILDVVETHTRRCCSQILIQTGLGDVRLDFGVRW